MASGKVRGLHIGILGAAALALLTLAVFRAEQTPGASPAGKALEVSSAPTQPAADLPQNHRAPSEAPQAKLDPIERPAPAPATPAGTVEAPRPQDPAEVQDDREPVSEEKILALHGREPLTAKHPHVAPAIEVHGRHPELMMHPCVVGTAVGLDDEGRIAIVIMTKADATDLPKSIEGYPVVVWKTGPINAMRQEVKAQARPGGGTSVDPTKKFRPEVPIGVSTGHFSITAGTLGCKVFKAGDTSGSSFALSNNHVYANQNNALIGDNALQPGKYDGGINPGDRIGSLDAFISISFTSDTTNSVDAAIVKIDPTVTLLRSTPGGAGYGTPSATTTTAALNMTVRKYGRTTKYTKGVVAGIDATVNVGYDVGTAKFVGQVVVQGTPKPGGFSAGGDSGSLIVQDVTWKPTGLLFAGSNTATIANPIDAVLGALGITIDGN